MGQYGRRSSGKSWLMIMKARGAPAGHLTVDSPGCDSSVTFLSLPGSASNVSGSHAAVRQISERRAPRPPPARDLWARRC